MKNNLIINQYASTTKNGFGGRSFYIAKSLSQDYKVSLVVGSYNHLLIKKEHQKKEIIETLRGSLLINPLKLFKYKNPRSILRIVNWFLFCFKIIFLSKKRIGFIPDAIIYSSPPLIGFLGAYLLGIRMRCSVYFEVRDI